MRIPKRFKLFGQTITVVYKPELLASHSWSGAASYVKGEIEMMPVSDAFPRSEAQQGQTFCHELMHFMLDAAGAEDAAKDEKHVEIMGRLLHQALTTMEYEEE